MKPMSDKAQAALNRVVDKLKTGDLSPIRQVATLRLPDDAPASKWVFSNQLLAYAQTGDLDCRGFKQWEKAGRKIIKGEKSAYILRPILVPDDDSNDEDARKCVGVWPVAVFGYHQTEPKAGCEDWTVTYEPHDLPPLADLAARLGVTVRYTGGMIAVGALGMYVQDDNEMTLGSTEPSVFWHELGHALHSRLGHRKKKKGQDPFRETVAELTACVLAALYGDTDHTGNAWLYIRHYNPDDPLQAVLSAIGEVQRIVAFIENGHEEGGDDGQATD